MKVKLGQFIETKSVSMEKKMKKWKQKKKKVTAQANAAIEKWKKIELFLFKTIIFMICWYRVKLK